MYKQIFAVCMVLCLAGSALAQGDSFLNMLLLRNMMQPQGSDAAMAQSSNTVAGSGAGAQSQGFNRMFPFIYGNALDIDPMMMMFMARGGML